MLKNAVVIDSASTGEVVEPGVLVELRYDGDDDAVTYLVGSIEERDETYDVLSTELAARPGAPRRGAGRDASPTRVRERELSVTVVAVRPRE